MILNLIFLVISTFIVNYVAGKEHTFLDKNPKGKNANTHYHIKWITNQTSYPLKLNIPIQENALNNQSLERDWLRMSDNKLVSKLPDLFKNYLVSETVSKSQMLLLNYDNKTHDQLSSYEPKLVLKADPSVFLDAKPRDIFTLAYLKNHEIKAEKSFERIKLSCVADFLISNTNKDMTEAIMIQMEKYASFKIAIKDSSLFKQRKNLYNSNFFLIDKQDGSQFDRKFLPLGDSNSQQHLIFQQPSLQQQQQNKQQYQPMYEQSFQQLPPPVFQQPSLELQQQQQQQPPVFQQSSQQQPKPVFQQPSLQLQQQQPQQQFMPSSQQAAEYMQQIPFEQQQYIVSQIPIQQQNHNQNANFYSYENFQNDMNRYYKSLVHSVNPADIAYINNLRHTVNSANMGSLLTNYGSFLGRFKRSKRQIEKEVEINAHKSEELDYDPKKFTKIRLSLGAVSLYRPFESEEGVSCELNLVNKDDGNLEFHSKIFKTIRTDDDEETTTTPGTQEDTPIVKPGHHADPLSDMTKNIIHNQHTKVDTQDSLIHDLVDEAKKAEQKHKEPVMFFFDKIKPNETYDEADWAKVAKYTSTSSHCSSTSLSVLLAFVCLIKFF